MAGPTPDDNFESQLRRLLADNRKLEAVKIYRQQTGVSLLEAKNAVEQLEQGGLPLEQSEGDDADLEAEILNMLRQGPKLEAVKRFKQRTGCSLLEAKQAVESIAARNAVVVERNACLSGIVLLVILAALAVWLCAR